MPNRLQSFVITRGGSTLPYILKNSLVATKATNISVSFSTNVASTIYFIVVPKGTIPAPTFQDVKEKMVAYDYYGAEYIVGEYIDDSTNFVYNFEISGFRPQMDYQAYFWAESLDGNLGTQDVIVFNFTTLADYPLQVWLNTYASSVATADYQNLFAAIASVVGCNAARFESDTTVLGAKGSGDSTSRYSKTGLPNMRKKFGGSAYSPPGVGSGTQMTFIIFPDPTTPHSYNNADVYNYIHGNLSAINNAYSNLLNVNYIYSNQVEPDDIKWAAGIKPVGTATPYTISITGVSLNAAGNVHVMAIQKDQKRPLFFNTQESLSSAVRYLGEEMFDNQMEDEGLEEFYEIHSPNLRFLQSGGQQVCLVSMMNELTISCDGATLPASNFSRSDIDTYYTPADVTSYTVSRESDGTYYKGDSICNVAVTGANIEAVILLENLQPDTTYTIYMAATDGYVNYPMRMMDSYIYSLEVKTPPAVAVTTGVLNLSASVLLGLLLFMLIFA